MNMQSYFHLAKIHQYQLKKRNHDLHEKSFLTCKSKQ